MRYNNYIKIYLIDPLKMDASLDKKHRPNMIGHCCKICICSITYDVKNNKSLKIRYYKDKKEAVKESFKLIDTAIKYLKNKGIKTSEIEDYYDINIKVNSDDLLRLYDKHKNILNNIKVRRCYVSSHDFINSRMSTTEKRDLAWVTKIKNELLSTNRNIEKILMN